MATPDYETPVLVVGAGPAGLIAALQLSRNGTRCMLVERNLTTTKWPKMDITNCRSMELLKRLGIDQGLREIGVVSRYSFDVNFSNGLSDPGELIARWDLPSVDDWRDRIKKQNDGSMPREPYQRCSQAIFEAWLKPKMQESELIETHFGWKLESLLESHSHVDSTVVDQEGQRYVIRSQYVIGCDGAGSKVRAAIGSTLEGGPVPGAMHLVHFKSRDLSRLHKQGQFWHIFFTDGSCIIAQDEIDTWTLHRRVPIGTDVSNVDPRETVYMGLGGEHGPFKIDIDEILVTSTWRPNIYLADKYASDRRRVFISGDAAHQNIPTGGYGMNTAVGDSFDIAWKIAAVLAGYGGPGLLDSYEIERRPVGERNIERSGVHFSVHQAYVDWVAKASGRLDTTTSVGQALRDKIRAHVQQHDGENKDHGIELGYRHPESPVIVSDTSTAEPAWNYRDYIPSTWPGVRAPHVFLSDKESSIFDHFGSGAQYTLVDFEADGRHSRVFEDAASKAKVPLKVVHLPTESHVRKIWERDAVLVRPDDFVAWRADAFGSVLSASQADEVLAIATGRKETSSTSGRNGILHGVHGTAFTATVGNERHEMVSGLAAFQQ